jgi:predicted Fe-Mo cluster-binding NifX family protein
MKVAISTWGPTLDDLVDERFGRAEYLLLVDESLEVEVVDNTMNRDALQGAGLGAAEKVVEGGATAVITGHLGPKAFNALQAAGVAGYSGTGMTARDAFESLRAGRLQPLSEGKAHNGLH